LNYCVGTSFPNFQSQKTAREKGDGQKNVCPINFATFFQQIQIPTLKIKIAYISQFETNSIG
jgi:hypothetical protein